ncbi:MAG: DUF1223 domain-containing protein [Spirosomataceae bacterium]
MYHSLIVLLLSLFAFSDKPVATPISQGFAVLELFTSQGCSSCPAADNLVAKVYQEAQQGGKQVYVLAYHVDYWNHLGWKDPYSQAQFTQRQYEYRDFFKNRSVYTPQLVVNGTEEFVGSNAAKLNTSLQRNLNGTPSITIDINQITWQQGKVSFVCLLKQLPQDAILHAALLSKSTETSVARGENEGRNLTNTNIVRVFQTRSISTLSNNFSFALPEGLNKENGKIVVFVQQKGSWRILGVGSI